MRRPLPSRSIEPGLVERRQRPDHVERADAAARRDLVGTGEPSRRQPRRTPCGPSGRAGRARRGRRRTGALSPGSPSPIEPDHREHVVDGGDQQRRVLLAAQQVVAADRHRRGDRPGHRHQRPAERAGVPRGVRRTRTGRRLDHDDAGRERRDQPVAGEEAPALRCAARRALRDQQPGRRRPARTARRCPADRAGRARRPRPAPSCRAPRARPGAPRRRCRRRRRTRP